MNAPTLIEKLSALTGHKRFDVDSRAVWLRQHGLLSKGGRGLNATDMSAADAVNLLLAIAVGGTARSVLFEVPRYRLLKDAQGRELGPFLEDCLKRVPPAKMAIRRVRFCRTIKEVKVETTNDDIFFSREPLIQEERTGMMARVDFTINGNALWTIAQDL